METTASFGYWLRRKRKALDLTQQALADRVGCSLAAIKKIEGDERRPSRQIAERLADVLAVSADQREAFLEIARGLRSPDSLSLAREAVAASPPTGTVTMLYTDIEDSTRLWGQFPQLMADAQARHAAILRGAIESSQGHIFEAVGDSFCAAFPTAGAAIRAALSSQHELLAEPWGDAKIRVRMGLHTGKAEVQADGRYGDYVTLSHVQRVMSAGHGGQVLVSLATQELLQDELPDGVELRDLGAYQLKGFERAEHIFQLVAPGLPADFPSLNLPAMLPNNLPAQLTSFIGRERELEELTRLWGTTRLLTLTGPGGTGKTRLALRLAENLLRAFPNGVWLVELAPLTDPALVQQTIATGLGVREQPGRSIAAALIDFVRSKSLVIVLDNCEHLLDSCARVADELLRSAPGLKILASSREALGITGETAYRVPSLPLPAARQVTESGQLAQNDCVRLFVDRAVSAYSGFQLTEQNAPIIAEVCRRLDGIPLAIELAAARTKLFTPQEIAARLGERFKLLTGGSRTALERHQTLFALIDWSHQLLSEQERVLLRRLSVFAGGWSLGAAQAVCGDGLGEDLLETLGHLADKSLVMVDRPGESAEGRYRLLETIRQYARDRLLESGEPQAVRDRHLDYFLRLVRAAEPRLRSLEQMEWIERLETELDNVRAALSWSLESDQTITALEMAGSLFYFWGLGAHMSEGQRWLEAALALAAREQNGMAGLEAASANSTAAAHRAKALHASAWFQMALTFDIKAGRQVAEDSLRLWRELGDKRWIALTLEVISLIDGTEGDIDAGIAKLEEGVSLGRQIDDPLPLAVCLVRLGDTVKLKGTQMAAAQGFLEEGVAVGRKVGDRSVLSEGLRELGSVYYSQGKLTDAAVVIREALEQARTLGSILQICLALLELVCVSCLQDDMPKARGYCHELWAVCRDTGWIMAIGFGLWAFGLADCFGGEPSKGTQELGAIDLLLRQRGVDLFGDGTSPLQRVCRQALDSARSKLGPTAFDAAWTDGQRMSVEDAIALATRNESTHV